MIESYVKIRGLGHRFGHVDAIDRLDLDVPAGEFVALIGPSGCGKTTLLRSLAGLIMPSVGSVEIGNRDVRGRPGAAGYLPQKDLLLPWRRASENATVGAEIAGSSKREARRRAGHLFEKFGLSGFERAWPHELSGGMRQRVAVLRTFLLPHQVLLLDEPLGALDAITRRRMQEWLEGVWLADRRTTLLVTHDVEEALFLADRVVVLSERPGRIVDDFRVDLSRPRRLEVSTSPEFVEMKSRVLNSLTLP